MPPEGVHFGRTKFIYGRGANFVFMHGSNRCRLHLKKTANPNYFDQRRDSGEGWLRLVGIPGKKGATCR